jgi:hypothetical protein
MGGRSKTVNETGYIQANVYVVGISSDMVQNRSMSAAVASATRNATQSARSSSSSFTYGTRTASVRNGVLSLQPANARSESRSHSTGARPASRGRWQQYGCYVYYIVIKLSACIRRIPVYSTKHPSIGSCIDQCRHIPEPGYRSLPSDGRSCMCDGPPQLSSSIILGHHHQHTGSGLPSDSSITRMFNIIVFYYGTKTQSWG